MQAVFLDCGVLRPQLKRDPLGSGALLHQSTRPLRVWELGPVAWFVALLRWLMGGPDPTIVDVIEGSITRVWDANGCGPDCCPNDYLFELDHVRYLQVSSWTLLDYKASERPTSRMRFELARNPRCLLAVGYEGEPVAVQSPELDDDVPWTRQCQLLTRQDLPAALLARVAAA